MKNLSTLLVAIVITIGAAARDAHADVVWRANAYENNFVPFGEDGTLGRPVPGDQLGNTITLDGTSRSLDRITVRVALNNQFGTPSPSTDTWTVDLYLNDGAVDPASGLMQPGTPIGSASASVSMPPFDAMVVFDFTGAGVVVPDSFTAIISSTHPTDTWFQAAGVAGPFSSMAPPNVGSGPNTLWYSSAASGWETNATWAIDDGATTNFVNMTVEASP